MKIEVLTMLELKGKLQELYRNLKGAAKQMLILVTKISIYSNLGLVDIKGEST